MTQPLWTAAEASAATKGRAIGDWHVTGVSIDTRTLKPGDLFVALLAARDGHDFVATALKNGAGAALVTHIPDGVSPDAPLLIVPDVLRALEALGIAARARTRAKIVGVTGSVGKTSTKEMLRAVLSSQGKTHAAEASYNNHWGVPLTLARMPVDADYAVIEIGMNHPGEIAPLAKMARPHVAMITTVAAAHLEAFENLDGIAHEKASIFEGLVPGGVAVLNGDLPTTPILLDTAKRHGAQILQFGHMPSCDYRLGDIQLSDDTTVVQAQTPQGPVLFKLSTAGRHFATNGLGVLAVATALGADRDIAATDLARWLPPAGRGTRERVVLDDALGAELVLIDDAFNANPTSMAASLEVLAAANPQNDMGRVSKGRRIAILGDMLELGPDEITLHAAIADLPFVARLSRIHCVGTRMRALYDALPEALRGDWEPDAKTMATKARRLVDAGDVVLVKGSKGSYVSLVVHAIRNLGHAAPDQD